MMKSTGDQTERVKDKQDLNAREQAERIKNQLGREDPDEKLQTGNEVARIERKIIQ